MLDMTYHSSQFLFENPAFSFIDKGSFPKNLYSDHSCYALELIKLCAKFSPAVQIVLPHYTSATPTLHTILEGYRILQEYFSIGFQGHKQNSHYGSPILKSLFFPHSKSSFWDCYTILAL